MKTYIKRQSDYGSEILAVVDSQKSVIKNKLLELYKKSDVCLEELLDNILIEGPTVAETVEIYAELLKKIESDQVIKITEGEKIHLA